MKDTLKDSDFIKPGYENLYGKIYLTSIGGIGNFMNRFIVLIIFFTLSAYLFASPKEVMIPITLTLINNIRVVITLLLCLIIFLRVRYIYKSSQPWKFGLEISMYFWGLICLFGISSIFIAVYMTENLYNGNYFLIYLDELLIVVFAIGYLLLFWRRGDVSRTNIASATKKVGSMGKFQIIGVVTFLVITFVNFPKEETLGYFAFLLISLACSIGFSTLICIIYCSFYKEGIDFDVYYQFMDGIEPNKNYPPDFWKNNKKKRMIKNPKKIVNFLFDYKYSIWSVKNNER